MSKRAGKAATEPDPVAGLHRLIREALAHTGGPVAVIHLLRHGRMLATDPSVGNTLEQLAVLLTAAQATGRVRPDVT
ncbi:hypothetical protein, partial [Streptomyces sp. NPDC005799]|uniref:hypothetical protein n=1 Tax=Streptomyces sp. NPDC005799 TaxID=3154678 RepID=UPI0033D1C328